MPPQTPLERLLIVVVGCLIAFGAIAALSGFFAGQDQAGVAGSAAGPGQVFPDQGDRVLAPGQPRPAYNSDPPTSGAHRPEAVAHNASTLTVDQQLEALAEGNVIFAYGSTAPPRGLASLAARVAPPFSPALALAGQAVILARIPGTDGVIALAWRHMLHVSSATDPQLRDFAGFWLGRGAPNRR